MTDKPAPTETAPESPKDDPLVKIRVTRAHTKIGTHIKGVGHEMQVPFSKAQLLKKDGSAVILF